MSEIQRDIEAEVARLARFYRVDGPAFDSIVGHLYFDDYVEIILGRNGFEVLIGDVHSTERLTSFAHSLGVPEHTVRLFQAFSMSFPGRIGYVKFCFGSDAGLPTMHCGTVERWPDVFAFMEDQPEFAGGITGLLSVADQNPICHLVGFTTDPRRSVPVMKVYWLVDRPGPGPEYPMLASARVSEGGVRAESKRYLMGASWDAARVDERWSGIVDIARQEFTDSAYLCISHLLLKDEVKERKVYVFRHDARVPASDRGRSFNLYYQEGMQLLYWNEIALAVRSFTNALYFQPDHADAHNNRGYCRIRLGEFRNALEDCEEARRLDPSISSDNSDYARSMLEQGAAEESGGSATGRRGG